MAETKRTSGKKSALPGELQSDDAAIVLERLLENHLELLSGAEGIWRSTLGEVSIEWLAFDVERPSEAAMELRAAFEICKGIVFYQPPLERRRIHWRARWARSSLLKNSWTIALPSGNGFPSERSEEEGK
jgi:hypothetical protein